MKLIHQSGLGRFLLFQYDELCSKGNFSREDIVTVLTAHQVKDVTQ